MTKESKTILVTGGAGFIGSNYLNKYVPIRKDWTFVCIDALTYAGRMENLKVIDRKNFTFEKADIRDLKALRKIFARHSPYGVIHFAAESHVDVSIKNPGLFIETNVTGTLNLLSSAKEFGVRRFLHVSTDEVYGHLESKKGTFTEKSSIAPRNPYSASKAAAEHLVAAYHNTFGLETVITRSSNNYGPNQDNTKLISSFLEKLLSGEKVPVYGRGEQIRSWIYVEDNVDAIDLVFRKGKRGEVYNIGGDDEIRNIDLARKLIALTGRDESAISYVPDRPGHDFRYSLDSSKVRELGWKPRFTLHKGLGKTLASINYLGAKPRGMMRAHSRSHHIRGGAAGYLP